MSRQMRHKWQGHHMLFFPISFFENTGFKFSCLYFQGSFPTLQNKTSNFKLPPSVTPLAERTYTGTTANTTTLVRMFETVLITSCFFSPSLLIEDPFLQSSSYGEILIELDSKQPKASNCWCNP